MQTTVSWPFATPQLLSHTRLKVHSRRMRCVMHVASLSRQHTAICRKTLQQRNGAHRIRYEWTFTLSDNWSRDGHGSTFHNPTQQSTQPDLSHSVSDPAQATAVDVSNAYVSRRYEKPHRKLYYMINVIIILCISIAKKICQIPVSQCSVAIKNNYTRWSIVSCVSFWPRQHSVAR